MFRQCKIESNSPTDACAIPKKIANPITIALRTDRINRHSLLRRRNPQQPLVSESKSRRNRIKSEKGNRMDSMPAISRSCCKVCNIARQTSAAQGNHGSLGRQAFLCYQLHLLAKSIELTERSVQVGCDSNASKFFVHDRHGEDPMFVEQIFRHSLRIGAVDVNICNCA